MEFEYDTMENDENWSNIRGERDEELDRIENENYSDGMEEMEDYEESDEEGESQFNFLDEDGESEEGYEEFDEENDIMMSRSQNGDINFDEFDEESEEYDEYDTMEKEYDTIENDESEIVYPDDMYGNIDNDNLDADYADATDAKYYKEDDYEREEEMEEVEALESDIEDTMEEEETERTVSVETKGVLLPDGTVEDTLNMFDEALCSKSTLMRTSLEDFVSTAALVDGETSLECASDAATLTTCIICNKCTNCNDKFYQLKKEQNGSCDEQSELFKYCGCDACQEEEKVLLACLCPNLAASKLAKSAASNLGIPLALTSTNLAAAKLANSAASNLGISLALTSILLSILFLN